jgi:hypothetical protein
MLGKFWVLEEGFAEKAEGKYENKYLNNWEL